VGRERGVWRGGVVVVGKMGSVPTMVEWQRYVRWGTGRQRQYIGEVGAMSGSRFVVHVRVPHRRSTTREARL